MKKNYSGKNKNVIEWSPQKSNLHLPTNLIITDLQLCKIQSCTADNGQDGSRIASSF